MLNDKGLFSIGKRNHTAIRKMLWQHGLLLEAEQVGGNEPAHPLPARHRWTTLVKTRGQTLHL